MHGEKIVMRISSKLNLTREIKELGLDSVEMETLQHMLAKPYGILFVTGPTGSGKSTTLYTALSALNKEQVNIVTVEDPVEADIEGINQIREQVWEKIGPFAEYMKEKEHTVEERTRMLYEMIVKDDIQERLSEKEQEFATQGDQAMVKEYSQIYGMIMELLDKMVQMLGSETITAKEYGQLLDVGFQEMRVGIIPPTADQVLIGEMERTRLKDIKVLFFAGVNDGIIPKHGGKAGLLSESDREFLDSRQVALAPTARESMYIQRFYLYLNLTKPSRCLYLSYAQSNAQGQAQSPAYLIALILRMYPKLVIQDNPKDEISQMQIAQQATEILLEGLRKDGEQEQNDGWKELFSWYLRSEEWREQCLAGFGRHTREHRRAASEKRRQWHSTGRTGQQ